jgi:signal peptidase II
MEMGGIILAAAATFLADRVSKAIALRSLRAGRPARRILRPVANDRPPFVRLAPRPVLIAIWLSAAACGFAALEYSPALSSRGLIGLGLAIALTGAASNLADRLSQRVVVDFIAIGWWPVFNVADAAIVGGAVVAAVSLW